MSSFVSHPSVRIKGTENNYNPITCMDSNCVDKTPHMHCPFCVKTELFHDPTIIKAHYRVKHVDKGLEFAGLKVLRCSDSCDIVGAIKGEKKFKGAHWHCYKCRNGFNRRDEALKHFKTHFRNPQTTFQIQVTQDVNLMCQNNHQANQTAVEIISQDMLQIHPALTEAVMTTTADSTYYNNETVANEKDGDGDASVAANETVGTSEQTLIIQDDGTLELHNSPVAGEQIVVVSNGNNKGTWMQQKQDFQRRIKTLEEVNKRITKEKEETEAKYKKEIVELKLQIQMQSNEINSYQKREEELLTQLSVNLDERMQHLLNNMQIHHQNLLHQQLIQLKREFVQMQETSPDADEVSTINIISEPAKDSEGGETMTVVMSVESMEQEEVTHITDVSEVNTSTGEVITYACDVSTTETPDSDEDDEICVDDTDNETGKRKANSPDHVVKRSRDQ